MISVLFIQCPPSFTMQCDLNYTGINLQTIQDKEIILFLVNKYTGGISSVMGD